MSFDARRARCLSMTLEARAREAVARFVRTLGRLGCDLNDIGRVVLKTCCELTRAVAIYRFEE